MRESEVKGIKKNIYKKSNKTNDNNCCIMTPLKKQQQQQKTTTTTKVNKIDSKINSSRNYSPCVNIGVSDFVVFMLFSCYIK